MCAALPGELRLITFRYPFYHLIFEGGSISKKENGKILAVGSRGTVRDLLTVPSAPPRVAGVRGQLRAVVGDPHARLAALRQEGAGGAFRGPEAGPLRPAAADGGAAGHRRLRGQAALRRGTEGRQLQAIRLEETGVRPLHPRDEEGDQRLHQNGGHGSETPKSVGGPG